MRITAGRDHNDYHGYECDATCGSALLCGDVESTRQLEDPVRPSADFTFRGSLGQTQSGHEGFASYVDFVHAPLGDYGCDLLDLVIENQQALARLRFHGIHRGRFLGYAPTGKRVEWTGTALFTFREDKIADLWVLGDMHGLLQLLEQPAHG